MRFLHASGQRHSSFNENSLVVRVDLGERRILLMGDAEAGKRTDWENNDPLAYSIEGELLTCCTTELRADILVVGHHGSRTSSRRNFLNAVDADVYIVSSGPKSYSGVVLPDQIVITELESRGDIFRTDRDDIACATDNSKIGSDNDRNAGGCDNIRIVIDNTITANYLDISD